MLKANTSALSLEEEVRRYYLHEVRRYYLHEVRRYYNNGVMGHFCNSATNCCYMAGMISGSRDNVFYYSNNNNSTTVIIIVNGNFK